MTYLLLIGEIAEILAIRLPRDKVRIPWAQFQILLVIRNLPPLEPKAGVNAKCLVVKVPVMNPVSNDIKASNEDLNSESFLTECQLVGRLMEGTGHAGQTTASSPGDVPLIPVES